MHRVDVASDQIAFNSAPSIEHLAAVRTAIRHAEFLVGDDLMRRGGKSRDAIEQALTQVNSEATAYLSLPTFPGEKSLWGDLNASIAAFNGAVQRAVAQADVGAVEASRAALTVVAAAADRVSDAATRAIEFNAKNGRELALGIHRK